MVFSSGLFLVYFLPFFMTGYLLLKDNWRNAFLILLSLFFYWWGAPTFIFILLGVTSLNFLLAKQIRLSRRPKSWLTAYILSNLALLAYFKYANFFVQSANDMLSYFGAQSVEWTEVVLPIGISFFTFQSITYGVDVYRKEAAPQESLFNYWLYILFFPQLIAGPIVKYQLIATQLTNRKWNSSMLLDGFWRFTLGLSKKVLIANVLAEFGEALAHQNSVFYPASLTISWLGVLAYTFEIYFDFSGYSDMAIGLGKMAGFNLPENFNKPYLSHSITEFWKRWHMTLGDFMRNYLYIPLGGNRASTYRTYFNLVTVFFLSGLWHGASWNFIWWGLFHGTWLIIERIAKKPISRIPKFIQILLTFFIVVNGWALFDATSLNEAWLTLKGMYSSESTVALEHKNAFYFYAHLLIAATICILGLTRLHKLYFFTPSTLSKKWHLVTVTGLAGVFFMLCVSHVVTGSFNPFIYFQF